MAEIQGTVTQVLGNVVDVEFPARRVARHIRRG